MFDQMEREGVSKMPEYLKKINRSSVVQRVIDRLTEAMLSGELKPGDKIPTEMELWLVPYCSKLARSFLG